MDDLPDAVPGAPLVRHATRADLPRVAELAAQHAQYERAAPPAADLADRLARLLFDGPAPRLVCLLAELPGGEVAGYATCAPVLSTWDGRDYLHMDCLFLAPGHRGLGLGGLLMDAVVAEAAGRGMAEVQWQTPAWNEGAIRFYDRLGGRAMEKVRYSLPVSR
ncbi:GNAT family N-acetyltransferase [Streptomyces sp. NPDC059766]|uniref:GNAT family N-acetyltransferase n=1 Tax=Streptomyces sp. NPDC059766 TaxID=3346940 RepID=UPI00364A5A2C